MIPAVFSRCLAATALVISPMAIPNLVLAQDLGIDCHVARTTPGGKLVFDPKGQNRALCEADRATALNYTVLLQTVRDQVTQALRDLPPPLLADFIEHLERDERIGRWRPKPTDLDLLVNTNAALTWGQGILADSGIDPEVWGIQARACGPTGQGQVVVWLDDASLRDRWTPAMVQRTTYAWTEAREGLVAVERSPKIIDGAPNVPVTRRIDGHERLLDVCFDTPAGRHSALPRGALAMDATLSWRIDTETENTACVDPAEVGFERRRRDILRGFYVDDAGEPLLENGQMVSADDAWRVIRDTCRPPRDVTILDVQDCAAPGMLAGREVQGNVIYTYLFRERRGLLDPTAVIEHPVNGDGGWTPPGEIHTPQVPPDATFCAAGDYPDPEGPDSDIVDDVPVAECDVAHDGRFNQGSRAGYIRRIDYPADWPVADVEVSWIVDRCFAPVQATDAVRRARICPQGQTGEVTERAVVSWYDRTWADRAHNPRGDTRTAELRYAAWSADPDQTALAWYDRVSAGDWNVVRNTCQLPIVDDPVAPELDDDSDDRPDRPGGGGGGGGGGGDRTWDVDGDGWGDFATEREARAYMSQVAQDDPDATNPEFNLIRPAVVDCNVCHGPDRGSWAAPELDNHHQSRPNPRPRPSVSEFVNDFGEAVENFGEAVNNFFSGGNNNNNNNNNNNDADDDDNQDQGARPPPATERPRLRPCWPLCRRDT